MRRSTAFFAIALGALLTASACGRSAGTSTGSNTNWLERCADDSDCGAGTECWCEVCIRACTEASDCAAGACHDAAEIGCGVATTSGGSVCVASCATNADCAGVDRGAVCDNGACLLRPLLSGDGGAGATSGGAGAGSGGASGFGGIGGNAGTAAGGPSGVDLEQGSSLGVSSGHACVAFEGKVYCWGANQHGELGRTPGDTVREATLVPGVSDVSRVALSDNHSCALTASGDVYCWGSNDAGQVGGASAEKACPDYVLDKPGYYPCQPTSTRVDGVSGAVQIAVSSQRSCARLADGGVRCWGAVEELASWASAVTGATSVGVGPLGACAIIAGGELSCSFTFVSDALLNRSRSVALGGGTIPAAADGFVCVLDTSDGMPCFGNNRFHQLGSTPAPEIADIWFASSSVKMMALGDAHSCALSTEGRVTCWGKNTNGAVGLPPLASPACGYEVCEPTPQAVSVPPMLELAAGGERACGRSESGSIWCWGGFNRYTSSPVRVPGPWERNAAFCLDPLVAVAEEREDLVFAAGRGCVTDSDCSAVELDLRCDPTSGFASVSRASEPALRGALAELDADHCPQIVSSRCDVTSLTAPPAAHPICNGGVCELADPAHSGCDDSCACAAVRSASLGFYSNECEGFNLWPVVVWSCATCEDSAIYAVIMNRGSEAFRGDAVLSFEPLEGEPEDLLPAPVTVPLELEPGAISAAIRVKSVALASSTLRVTADGDCQPLDDASTSADFPSPVNACE